MVTEDSKLIQKVLKTAGVDLTFTTFDIKGIPGFDLQVLYKGEESLYEVERQNISFHVHILDLAENSVTNDMQFSCEDDTYRYTFNVEGVEPDFTGWAFMKVSFRSKEAI